MRLGQAGERPVAVADATGTVVLRVRADYAPSDKEPGTGPLGDIAS